jgi:DNA-binding response OmpR family regulator
MEKRASDVLELIEGEYPESSSADDARHWIAVYRELVSLAERAESRKASNAAEDQRRVNELSEHLEHLRSRLAFWQDKLLELIPIEFDDERRTLSHDGRRVELTRREAELLRFMLAFPDRYFTSEQLVSQAWHSPRLSAEQLRSYVVRLRRLLEELHVPLQLSTEARRGYALRLSRKS